MLNYKIIKIDNFFSNEDFIEISKYAKNLNNKNEFDIYHNQIDVQNNIIKSTIDNNFLIKINKKYFPIALNILKELYPEKVQFISYCDFTIVKTKKKSKFPIHDDTPNKLLSGVVYLYPENNMGTVFYNSKNGNNKTEIEWKKNRAVFFARKERETWHSYGANNDHDRITLIYNLMTLDNKIKEICKIENKNYIYSKLRYKLNPYLFRILKKTI